MTILERLFDLLLDEPQAETAAMRPYAIQWVLLHIAGPQKDDNVNKLTDSERQYIANQLIAILQEPEQLKRHLTLAFLRSQHMLDTPSLKNVQALLNDDKILKGLRTKERNWVRSFAVGKPAGVMEEAAKTIGHMWLTANDWKSDNLFWWLDGYLDRIEYVSEFGKQNGKKPGRVLHAIDWHEHVLRAATKDVDYYRRLADTYIWSQGDEGFGASRSAMIGRAKEC